MQSRRAFLLALVLPNLPGCVGKGAEIVPVDEETARIDAHGVPRCETLDEYRWSFDDVAVQAGVQEPESRNRGAAGADFDNDGDIDLFTGNPGDDPGLLLNRGDGTFVAQPAGVPTTGWDAAVAAADLDDDGDDDLFLACGGFGTTCPNALHRNDGVDADGFVVWTDLSDRAGMAGVENASKGGAWGDYDNDGDLDLHVTTKDLTGTHDGTYPSRGGGDISDGPPPPDLAASTLDLLYRNDGDGVFTEVAVAAGVGIAQNAHRSTWLDYDEDGWLDLYVPVFRGPNKLFHNEGDGTFTDATTPLLAAPEWAFATVDRDFDQDGHVDLFVASETIDEEGVTEEHGLYLSDGAGGFAQAAAERGMGHLDLPIGDHPMGIQAEDIDGDGAPDLYIGNGNPMTDRSIFGDRLLVSDRDLLAGGTIRWHEETDAVDFPAVGYEDIYPYRTHGIVLDDLDDDGLVDLFVGNGGMYADQREPSRLFRNTSPCRHARVRVTVRGTRANRDGVGAHIRVMDALPGAETWTVHQWQSRSSGFNASRPRERTFGLGVTDGPYVVVVDWPDGGRDVLEGVSEGDRVVVVEGEHR